MENASKALIIAGSILIALLLVSVGIMLFNGSSGLFNSARSKMSDQEKSMFNQTFTVYEGKRVSGSTVKELLRTIIANNTDDENPKVFVSESQGAVSGTEPKSTEYVTSPSNTIKNAVQYTVSSYTNPKSGVVEVICISVTGTTTP